MAAIVARELAKTYRGTGAPVEALRGVSLTVAEGSFVAIMGPSGCGKSTLLHLCGAMDRPTRGAVRVLGESLEGLGDEALTRLRRERLGFVFQFFNLLPTLTVEENVALPLLLTGAGRGDAIARARRAAADVGLAHRLASRPQQLSGGEMQRTAIARAIVHEPGLLIADEPTGNLDSENGDRVLDLLTGLARERGVTLLMATHARDVAARADRVVHLRDGRLEREESRAGDVGDLARATL